VFDFQILLPRITDQQSRTARRSYGAQEADRYSLSRVAPWCSYKGGPPNRTVTSLEQFEVPASHTL
jgi:hypothetical protein